MKTYKARVIMKGKSYKQFIEGIDFLDDNKYYMLIFHAESLRDFSDFTGRFLENINSFITRFERD